MNPAFPIRIVSDGQFAVIRHFFRSVSFDASTVCRILRIKEMCDLGRVQWERTPLNDASVTLRVCIAIFLRGHSAPRQELRDVFGPEVLDALENSGLLRPSKINLESLVCPVWFYPVQSFLVASDRRDDPDGLPYSPAEDIVFPAIYAGTSRFLRLIPEALHGEALDLCGGSGIGALLFSERNARTALTADVTQRSAFFAQFNARLNGLPVKSLCGDLYEPVSGRSFHLITAHPPFVPAIGGTMVYRDGGANGEQITIRIVEGLPNHLRPGGTAIVLCVARDTVDAQLENRVRDWLGKHASEFDIIFGLEKVLSIEEVKQSMRKRGSQVSEADLNQMLERLQNSGTRQFVYGAIFIRRLHHQTALHPARVQLLPDGTANDFERLFRSRALIRQAGFTESLNSSRPQPAARLQMLARYAVIDSELNPTEFVFSLEHGLTAALRLDGWLVPLVARLTGKSTVAEVYEQAREANELMAGFLLEDFQKLIAHMIENGFLELPAAQLPQNPSI